MNQNGFSDDAKKNTSLSIVDDAYMNLLSVLEPNIQQNNFDIDDQDLLFSACARIGKLIFQPIKPLPKNYFSGPVSIEKYLEELSQFNSIRFRSEMLQPAWWQMDCGTLLAFRKDNKLPIVLFRKRGKYYIYDLFEKKEYPLSRDFLTNIDSKVYLFYKTLPERPLSWKDLGIIVFRNIFPDLKRIITLQFVMGIISLLVPIFTKIFFETIIPNADLPHLSQLSILLGITIASISFLGISQMLHIMRLRYKSNITMESAVWDRVIKLPIHFIKLFLSGDLAQRARAIDQIQQYISNAFITTILSSIFSILNLLLMFYFDVWLALYVTFFEIIIFGIIILFAGFIVRYQIKFLEIQGKLAGLVFQLISGISKIRVANRELNVFKVWALKFSEKNKVFLSAGIFALFFRTLIPLLIILETALLFIFVIQRGDALSFGNFMGFSVAYAQFMAAFLNLITIFTSSLTIMPLYERVKPILLASPEKTEQTIFLPDILGEIKVENVNFKYDSSSSFLLEDINFSISPGDFVAFVGSTGAGKSTLLRLLMGFELPLQGHIFYDGQDLNALNLGSLRKYFGVVLQNSELLPGTIYENLTLFDPDLSQEAIWQACESMQIAEEIRAMPMELHTYISEHAGNISVGQKQRLLLTRAIIHKPKILFLDEASSALDNITQEKIHNVLFNLGITRFVITHRLNAIKSADRIYVLKQGKIVESGNFQDLISKKGVFAALCKNSIFK